jgi:hypothetical protein
MKKFIIGLLALGFLVSCGTAETVSEDSIDDSSKQKVKSESVREGYEEM